MTQKNFQKQPFQLVRRQGGTLEINRSRVYRFFRTALNFSRRFTFVDKLTED